MLFVQHDFEVAESDTEIEVKWRDVADGMPLLFYWPLSILNAMSLLDFSVL